MFPWRTALANVTAGLEFAGVTKQEAEERAIDWLARVGLEQHKDKYPHQMSGGMRKRAVLSANLNP
ncbi:ABC transporter ATP-binding protein [Oligella ureolytica]